MENTDRMNELVYLYVMSENGVETMRNEDSASGMIIA